MPMTVKLLLSGGLGNQLFQYCAARALSIKLGVDLNIDLRFYTGVTDQSRDHWITRFPIKAHITHYRNHTHAHGIFSRIRNRAFETRRIFRSNLGYNSQFENLTDRTVLNGLFQSPRYFEDYYSVISNEIDISNSSSLKSEKLIVELGLHDLVGVHVRRGDYLTHQSFSMQNPKLYYSKVMAEIAACGDRAIIFSDDIAWCRDQHIFSGAVFFPYRPEIPPFIDLFAMSSCKILYIANSTFSWWAGWFAHHRGAPVVAPTNWILGNRGVDIDLYPRTWRILE